MIMRSGIFYEMISYLANASKEQLAEDFRDISAYSEGPLASEYIDAMLNFSQENIYITEDSLIQTSKPDLTEEFNSSGYCLAA